MKPVCIRCRFPKRTSYRPDGPYAAIIWRKYDSRAYAFVIFNAYFDNFAVNDSTILAVIIHEVKQSLVPSYHMHLKVIVEHLAIHSVHRLDVLIVDGCSFPTVP